MSRGADNVIVELLNRKLLITSDPQILGEEIIDALEAEDYRIVHKDQVRTLHEFICAITGMTP